VIVPGVDLLDCFTEKVLGLCGRNNFDHTFNDLFLHVIVCVGHRLTNLS
jgi:hypothetical protein